MHKTPRPPAWRTPVRALLGAACLVLVAIAAPLLPAQSAEGGPAAPTASPAPAAFTEIPATRDTLADLRRGGFVLYLRHGPTDNARADAAPNLDLNDCATQRPLTAEGRAVCGRVGEALRQARIPIGEVRMSPLCRCKDCTAAVLGPGNPAVVDPELMYTANLTVAQKAPIIANTRRLLSAPPAPGTNRLLVAHGPNLMDLMGYFPKEATLVVFRPGGPDGYTYVASIPPARWPDLLN